jgi:hypothetical protein
MSKEKVKEDIEDIICGFDVSALDDDTITAIIEAVADYIVEND